jgi:hypothetical protein
MSKKQRGIKSEGMNRKFNDPRCWTTEGMSNQMKTLDRWKRFNFLKVVIVAVIIVSFIGYQTHTFVEVGKWEWSVGSEISTLQEGEEGNPLEGLPLDGLDGLLGEFDSEFLKAIGEWFTNIDMNMTFDLEDMEELAAKLNETLGENATIEDFFESVQNGTLAENVIRDVVTVWVDSMIANLPESWFDPLELVGKYVGKVEVKQWEFGLFILINETQAYLVNQSYLSIKTNEQVTIELSLGYIMTNIINAARPIFIDTMVEMLIEQVEEGEEPMETENPFDNLFESILKEIPLGIGFHTKQSVNGFALISEGSVNLGGLLGGM